MCNTIDSLTRTLKDYTITRKNSNAIAVVCVCTANVKKLFASDMGAPSAEKLWKVPESIPESVAVFPFRFRNR